MNKKDLLVLTSSIPRYTGDHSGNFVHTLCSEIAKYHNCTVLAPHHKKAEHSNNITYSKLYFKYFYPVDLQLLCYGNGITENIKHNISLIFLVPFFLISFFLSAFRLSEKSKVIHSHWMFPAGLIGAIIKKIRNRKHILTVHSGGAFFISNIPFSKYILKFIYNYSDQIVCVSNKLKEELKEKIGSDNKLSVYPMCLDIEEVEEYLTSVMPNRKTFKILYIGRLVKIKGVEYLIRAVSEMKNLELYIGGEGILRKKLEKTALELNVCPIFLGHIKGDQKKEIYTSCDIVVIPSIESKRGRAEGVPLVILEAFNYGKPVIGSNTGGIKDVIEDGHNGFLFEQKDVHMLKTKIECLQRDSQLFERMKTNARKSAFKYSTENCAAFYNKLYLNKCI